MSDKEDAIRQANERAEMFELAAANPEASAEGRAHWVDLAEINRQIALTLSAEREPTTYSDSLPWA